MSCEEKIFTGLLFSREHLGDDIMKIKKITINRRKK
jgi:hypothetical protein